MTHSKHTLFTFPPKESFEELAFEDLNEGNFAQLYLMFESDNSPFVDKQFKTYTAAEEYAKYIEKYGATAPKHGSHDWLFLWQNNYAGILHLYDLSLETFAENNRRCWVGFATTEKYRNRGITQKAVSHFINYIFKNYPLINYIHAMTFQENQPAQNLLLKLGFKQDLTERMSKEHNFYILQRV